MANIRNVFKSQEDVDKEFMGHIEKDPATKCWNWTPKIFRFRHDILVLNPRHYALQIAGFTLEKGRNYQPGCGNPRCVNPDHVIMRHDGSRPNINIPLYLDLGMEHKYHGPTFGNDFQFPNSIIAKKYHVSKKEAQRARDVTFDLIEIVRQSHTSIDRLAHMYKCGPSYITKIRSLSKEDFKKLDAKSTEMESLNNQSDINPEGLAFVRSKKRGGM